MAKKKSKKGKKSTSKVSKKGKKDKKVKKGKSKKKVVKVKKKKKSEHQNHLKGMRKLDAKIVAQIRKNFKDGNGLSITKIWDIVKKKGYKVTYASVRNVCVRTTWDHVK